MGMRLTLVLHITYLWMPEIPLGGGGDGGVFL